MILNTNQIYTGVWHIDSVNAFNSVVYGFKSIHTTSTNHIGIGNMYTFSYWLIYHDSELLR